MQKFIFQLFQKLLSIIYFFKRAFLVFLPGSILQKLIQSDLCAWQHFGAHSLPLSGTCGEWFSYCCLWCLSWLYLKKKTMYPMVMLFNFYLCGCIAIFNVFIDVFCSVPLLYIFHWKRMLNCWCRFGDEPLGPEIGVGNSFSYAFLVEHILWNFTIEFLYVKITC